MAQLKRPAERTTTSHSKKQRVTKSKETSEFHDYSHGDESTEECRIDSQSTNVADEKLAINFAEHLTAVNLHADERKAWAKDFEKEVLARRNKLATKIKDAKQRVYDKREAFKRSMLPILSVAMQDSHIDPSVPSTVQLPLQLKMAQTTNLVTEASQLLKGCETIIACYEELAETGPVSSSMTKLRDTFTNDSRALQVALTGARKMVANHIQSQTLSEQSKSPHRFDVNEEEEVFGRKVLKNSIGQKRDSSGGLVLGIMCRDLGKAVGKMQHVIDT